MTGVDPADAATSKSEGKLETDYTQFLDASALDGARLGIARDFMGQDGDVDWIIEASLDTLREAGATIVDVELPEWLLEVRGEFYSTIRDREFRAQIAEYLATLGPSYPKTLAELLERSKKLTAPGGSGRPEPVSLESSKAGRRKRLARGFRIYRHVRSRLAARPRLRGGNPSAKRIWTRSSTRRRRAARDERISIVARVERVVVGPRRDSRTSRAFPISSCPRASPETVFRSRFLFSAPLSRSHVCSRSAMLSSRRQKRVVCRSTRHRSRERRSPTE